jgi:PAS domain S-box-containing protein
MAAHSQSGNVAGPDAGIRTGKPMTESSFRHLLLRLACIPLLALCAFLAILGFELREIALRRMATTQATSVLLQSQSIQKEIIDQETGIRGYLAAQDVQFLKPYQDASAHLDGAFAALRASASFNPLLSDKVSAISKTYQNFAQINRALLRNNASPDTVVELLDQQRQTMDTLRGEFAGLNSIQNNTRDTNRKALAILFDRLPGLALGGASLLVILLVWYGVTLFREITQAFHKQIDLANLRRAYFQTTLQSIGDGVIVCDDYGKITIMNSTAEEITGWAKDDAMGRSLGEVFQIIDEATRLPVENPVDKVWRLNAVVTLANHTLLVRRDGTEVPVDDSGAPIRNADGSLSGIVLVFRSVAERRQAANLLKQSQEHLQAIYNTSLSYIGILDLEGRVLDCNRASLEFAGNKREDVVGQPFWECPCSRTRRACPIKCAPQSFKVWMVSRRAPKWSLFGLTARVCDSTSR